MTCLICYEDIGGGEGDRSRATRHRESTEGDGLSTWCTYSLRHLGACDLLLDWQWPQKAEKLLSCYRFLLPGRSTDESWWERGGYFPLNTDLGSAVVSTWC